MDFQNWKDEEDVGDEKEPFEEVSGQCIMTNILLKLSQASIISILLSVLCWMSIETLTFYPFNE